MKRTLRMCLVRLHRAADALDEIEERLGEEWQEEQWDAVSSARQAIAERLHELEGGSDE